MFYQKYVFKYWTLGMYVVSSFASLKLCMACEINSPDFCWRVFMVWLSRADSVGNASFNLNWDSLVDLFNDDFGHILTFFYFLLFTFLLILVNCFWNILAVVYINLFAVSSRLPFFVFTLLKTCRFGII